jgi:hypothetical protein
MDEVTVTVVFDGASSWRVPMDQWPAQIQRELLEHEQGHYDITALIARDLFIQYMKLKNSVYDNQNDGARDYRSCGQIFAANLTKAQDAYDDETGHSQAHVFTPNSGFVTPPHQKGSTQAKWEGIIASAFIRPRNPRESAPDGSPYKMQLMDVLVQAGVQFMPYS